MLNLSFGNPEFLKGYWVNKRELVDELNYDTKYCHGGIQELKDNIVGIHKKSNNHNTDNKHIVIGNGATQLITAILYCLNKPVYIKPPYYFRFKNMCDLAGIKLLNKRPIISQYTELITTPNNPDNKTVPPLNKNDILDLSYNWKQYTNPINHDHNITVFSFSKAFGFASTRIGWAIIRDEGLFNDVTNYIEYNTSGVSIEAQNKAMRVLKNQINNKDDVFDFGRKVLYNRWERINELDTPFEVINNSGMFLWCKGEVPPGIVGINGKYFGDSEDKFRLNIGCSEEEFEKFVEIINNAG